MLKVSLLYCAEIDYKARSHSFAFIVVLQIFTVSSDAIQHIMCGISLSITHNNGPINITLPWWTSCAIFLS